MVDPRPIGDFLQQPGLSHPGRADELDDLHSVLLPGSAHRFDRGGKLGLPAREP
jgi:hypothetical protein